MNWIFKRFRIVISISLIISTVVTYLIAYLPMTKELEMTTLQSFVITAQANEHTAVQFIQNCKDGVASLSSRTMMRDIISEYRNGRISSGEMTASTQAHFTDSIRVLQNIKGAYRFTDGIQIASFGQGDTGKLVPEGGVTELYYELDEQNFVMIVYSPIIYRGDNLGFDVVFFDLNKMINALNKDYTLFTIIDSKSAAAVTNGDIRKIDVNDVMLTDDGKFITYINSVEGTDKSFYIKILKEQLFKSIRKISIFNLIAVLLSNIVLMLITNFVISDLSCTN
jgi:hypothetical protein